MSVPPSTVTSAGDISVHGRGGEVIVVQIAGTSSANLSFEIIGASPIALTDSGTPDQYLLVIPQGVVAAIPGQGTQFALRLLGGAVPVVVWEGSIKWRGFTAS